MLKTYTYIPNFYHKCLTKTITCIFRKRDLTKSPNLQLLDHISAIIDNYKEQYFWPYHKGLPGILPFTMKYRYNLNYIGHYSYLPSWNALLPE